jgi:hypothetical protein
MLIHTTLLLSFPQNSKAIQRARVPTDTQGTTYPKYIVPPSAFLIDEANGKRTASHIFMASQGQVTSPEFPTVGKRSNINEK